MINNIKYHKIELKELEHQVLKFYLKLVLLSEEIETEVDEY